MSRPASLPQPIRDAILVWFAANGRPLPFRRTRDPYAVLVAETIAQQTQAARAAERWERFMGRFPDVRALAAATPADVLREWRGLGYDRRGLALWRAARVIVGEFGGRVPDDIAVLQTLPGVGPYTARAVAAIAFGKPAGAVDVNVRRVLGRLLGGVEGLTPRDTQVVADSAVASTEPATWTHAVMDLGALVCRPRAPRCHDCPVRRMCAYAVAPGTRPAPVPVARPTGPFPTTTRWLRGRIMDRLREAPDDAWVVLDAGIGSHGPEQVHRAVAALAGGGLVEMDRPSPTTVRARLATG